MQLKIKDRLTLCVEEPLNQYKGVANFTIDVIDGDIIEGNTDVDRLPYPNFGGEGDSTSYYVRPPLHFDGIHNEVSSISVLKQTFRDPCVSRLRLCISDNTVTPINSTDKEEEDKEESP